MDIREPLDRIGQCLLVDLGVLGADAVADNAVVIGGKRNWCIGYHNSVTNNIEHLLLNSRALCQQYKIDALSPAQSQAPESYLGMHRQRELAVRLGRRPGTFDCWRLNPALRRCAAEASVGGQRSGNIGKALETSGHRIHRRERRWTGRPSAQTPEIKTIQIKTLGGFSAASTALPRLRAAQLKTSSLIGILSMGIFGRTNPNSYLKTMRRVRWRTARKALLKLLQGPPMHLEQRILVTGGSGFLGSHLCERLLAENANVICVDNFFSGTRRNVEHLLEHKRFELIRHDVTFPLYIEVDQIYNLACPASPVHYQRDPVQTTKTSVHGAINMLGLAKRLRAKILQASTSEVYGDPNIHPQTEDYWGNVNPIGSRACYDEGKRCSETLFFDYRRQHNLHIKVARIFNTYGPRMHPNDGRVVSNFIVQSLLGKDITIYGDGSQTRSFCYVDDLIEGLIRLMDSDDNVTGPMNIGNPTEFTILELASQVIELTGSRSNIIHRPLPEDDPRQRQPDISKAKDILGWSPQTPLVEGLRHTIAYFEEMLRDQSIRVQLASASSSPLGPF